MMEGTGIKNQGTRWQLHLRNERAFGRIFRNIVQLDQGANSRVFEWATRSECLDIVEGSAFCETKEEMSKARLSEKKMVVVHLDRLTHYQGTTHGGRQEQLESNHR
jgi:hypothetical protein